MISFSVTGQVLERMLRHLMRTLYKEGSREFYQWNAEQRLEVGGDGDVTRILIDGTPPGKDTQYRIAMQDYHYGIVAETLGITHEELADKGRVRVVSTSAQDNIIEYFRKNKIPPTRRDGRISLGEPLGQR